MARGKRQWGFKLKKHEEEHEAINVRLHFHDVIGLLHKHIINFGFSTSRG
jgi:hypothetical protein